MGLFLIFACLFSLLDYGKSVPPRACFEPFRWEDCGRPPVHVLYHYKSGSRCEVGIWRGCLPNPNMFKDEYECINTCIYVERAQPEHFHLADQIPEYEIEKDIDTLESNITDATDTNTTDISDSTDSNVTINEDGPGSGNATTPEDGEASEAGNEASNVTDAEEASSTFGNESSTLAEESSSQSTTPDPANN